jgi:soluble lytic murein transglycosylase
VATDPANSYRLANYLIDLGLYRTAVFAAREVLNLAGMSDAATMNAPKYFNRVRFGTYFSDLVLPQTARNNLDPLFFYSMMRQESLYEGFVTSSAGARGLMQIIPVTGQEVADLSGWPPDFTPDDLYRPAVSIRLGADYLAMQAHAYDGDMYAALAAYNAGAGNASYWLGLSGDDPDLFLEVVSFQETENHIRSIYELFTIYTNLYATEAE